MTTPNVNPMDPGQFAWATLMEAIGRLEEGQKVIHDELRLLRSADQSQHKRISDLELSLAKELAEAKRESDIVNAANEQRIKVLETANRELRSLLYRLAGTATALGIGAGGSAHIF